jgi:hypothetical protein
LVFSQIRHTIHDVSFSSSDSIPRPFQQTESIKLPSITFVDKRNEHRLTKQKKKRKEESVQQSKYENGKCRGGQRQEGEFVK